MQHLLIKNSKYLWLYAIGDAVLVPTGNIVNEADEINCTPVVASAQDIVEDDVDRWRRKYPNVSISWGDEYRAKGDRPAENAVPKYDARRNNEEFLRNKTEVYSQSPNSLHRRSRRHRQHNSPDSDEVMFSLPV